MSRFTEAPPCVKNKHLEVEGLLFYGGKGREQPGTFHSSFSHTCIMWGQPELGVHWENSSHSTCRLSAMGRSSELAEKEKKKPSALHLKQGRFSSPSIPSCINPTGGYFADHNDWNNNPVIHFF